MAKLPSMFHSKRDRWLTLTLAFTADIELIAAVLLFVFVNDSAFVRWAVPAALLAGSALITWCLVGTNYRIMEDKLDIRTGPIRIVVPVDTISHVYRVRSLLAAPALSSDRLELVTTGPQGAVQISPAHPDLFIAALRERNPEIQVA